MTAEPANSRPEDRTFRALLAFAAALTAARVLALFLTPLELYPDEAQYWLWAQAPGWGYVSKPPMIAWLIALTTAIGGDGEAWVRLSAPLLHLVPPLALYRVGRSLYGRTEGVLAALLYALMPAVQVSALFIATDAPLMACLSLALLAYVELRQSETPGRRRLWALGFGLALGLAFLAKQAAVYFLIIALIHALIDRDARRAWRGWSLPLALLALLGVMGPNLYWQATHGFATLAHTTQENARWTPGALFNPGKLAEFVLGQFGVLGPIPFAVLIGGTVVLARRRTLQPADRLLLCFTLPPLIIVTAQAFISRAHAHWAAASYLAGSVLVAAWLVRWRARRWTFAALALQGLVAVLVLAVVAEPALVDLTGNGRRLQRVRGWQETARIVVSAARSAQSQAPFTAIAVEDRYLFNELRYYGRAYFSETGAAPLRMRASQGVALNEAELASPLRPQESRRVMIAETEGRPPAPRLPSDFAQVQPLGRWAIPVGGGRRRVVGLYSAQVPLGAR